MNKKIIEQQKVIDNLNRRLQKFETDRDTWADIERRCDDLCRNFIDDGPNN